jgi:hypothetical protein
MRVLAQSGQPSAALKQYETCHRVLADELGVEPSAETQALFKQIQRGAVSLKPDAVLNPPPLAAHNLPLPVTPLVGRERELAQVARLLDDPACRLMTLPVARTTRTGHRR